MKTLLLAFAMLMTLFCAAGTQAATPVWMDASVMKLKAELLAKYGDGQKLRIEKGLKQVAEFWLDSDGDASAFEQFVLSNFAGDQASQDTMFNRYEYLIEQLNGHMHEINRAFRTQADLDLGPLQSYDEIFAGYDPAAHVTDDFFQNKLAFTVLLNFPITSLDERLTAGATWTRRQWAEVRLAAWFSKRVPAEANLKYAQASSEADRYVSQYNIWMHHVLSEDNARLFPPKMRLLSHWNLRDQIKADYSDTTSGAIVRQRIIQRVMERIVTQTIPAVVIDNPGVDWNPFTNAVKLAEVNDAGVPPVPKAGIDNAPEADKRYATLLGTFKAARLIDTYSPTAPTLISRRFEEDREIPETRVRSMLEQILSSPIVPQVAKRIEARLGRPLEPFDIWYNGFRSRGRYTEEQLDNIVKARYPTSDAYKADIPNLLLKLGFSEERARYLAENIVVEPARGSGHAMGAEMRSERAHLRTRVEKTGMNYKGFNIAVHEMGHNIEQTFSLNLIDHTLLKGVPNTAFTEALAFVFQGHDLELLGLTSPDARSEALKVLDEFWGAYEIAGVALVDMTVWHWMYDHPNATPAELKNATLKIAKDIWNKYYAQHFNRKDVVLLAIYSHMIDSFMYLPDYPVGHLIEFQIEEQMRKAGAIGPEFERMARMGHVAPDLWMKNATGAPVGAEAILAAAERALKDVKSEAGR